MGISSLEWRADYNSLEMPSAISRIDANGIAFVLSFLLAIGAAVSPFSLFLRSKYFSDGYRWRGLNAQDAVPLLKTLGLAVAFASATVGSVLQNRAASHFCYWVFVGVFSATTAFGVWHSLQKARRARESSSN